MAGVYEHFRLDKKEPFYFGIFKNKFRPFEKARRNGIWDKIVSKTKYDVKIIKEGLTWEAACQMERDLIKQYGRIDKGNGILANLTDGGDGAVGLIRTEEHSRKISESLSGKVRSEESIKKQSESRRGLKDSEITKSKKSLAKKGKKPNNYGKKMPDSHRLNISERNKGNKYAAGENNGKTTLTLNDVIFIKKMWNPNCPINNSKQLAKKYNISVISVWAIATNRRWSHVKI